MTSERIDVKDMDSNTVEFYRLLKEATPEEVALATRYMKCLLAIQSGAYTEAEALNEEMQNELGSLSREEIISSLCAIEDSIRIHGGKL